MAPRKRGGTSIAYRIRGGNLLYRTRKLPPAVTDQALSLEKGNGFFWNCFLREEGGDQLILQDID